MTTGQHVQQLQQAQTQTLDDCRVCGGEIFPETLKLTGTLCWQCREEQARQERSSWCVLTPHKQGAMFFTREFAFEAAKGINNKGGLVK
jgi:hypothetical protein